jgi:hypothetical protein
MRPKPRWARLALKKMKVAAHRAVNGEFDQLCVSLDEGPENWMPGLFEPATAKITELETGTPAGRLPRYAKIEVGAAKDGGSEVGVPITWRSLDAQPPFPILGGRLRLYRLPDGTNRLELEGRYKPPAGAIGRAADAAVLYGVAQATVDEFVERVAAILSRNALGRSVAEQEAEKRLVREEETWR